MKCKRRSFILIISFFINIILSLKKNAILNEKLQHENDEFKLLISQLTKEKNSLQESLNKCETERKILKIKLEDTANKQVNLLL